MLIVPIGKCEKFRHSILKWIKKITYIPMFSLYAVCFQIDNIKNLIHVYTIIWLCFLVDTEKHQLHCVPHFRRIRWVYSASRFSNSTRPNVRSDDLIRIEHNWIRLFSVNSHTLNFAYNHVYFRNYKVIIPCRFWLSSVQCTK